VSPTSTSDVLSNKKLYPNFMRVVPADRYQVEAITVILEFFKWSYVSIVFTDSSYGRDGVKRLRSVLGQKGICISKTLEIGYECTPENMRKTLAKLQGHKSPKVVVLYIEIVDVELILRMVKSMGIERDFMWVASDSFSLGLPYDLRHMVVGSLTVRPYSKLVGEFEERMKLRFPSSKKTNAFGMPSTTTTSKNVSMDDEFNMYVPAGFYIDAVNALATGADLLIKERCPRSTSSEELRKCVNPVELCKRMRNLTFNGSYGEISFDQNGDVVGMYEIIQYQYDDNDQVNYVPVGSWDMRTNRLRIDEDQLRWPPTTATSDGNFSRTPPVLKCGDRCPAGSIYYFPKETCCWECRKCKNNEITDENLSICKICPEFYWPVDEQQKACEKIPPHFIQISDKTAIIVCSV
ncbi:metabotropic glutamate receptor 5, partial [Octopus bimaculoides]|uniref:metabotropic glutamate receptor 5 n=1 Tax=Octopus bimaculoides TaxID=37653 RepID=UPI00071E4633